MLQKITQKILISLILILPFSCFLFTKLDIWYTQGYFAQLLILVLFSIYLFSKSKPFGILFLWSGIITLYYCIGTQVVSKQLPILLFLPFFNFLCIAILFILITKYATKSTYITILKYYPYILLLLSIYAILQYLNLDQFFKYYDPTVHQDPIVGTMGNQMHFSHYLAITLPMIFSWSNKYRNPLILLVIFIIALTGSLSGILIALILVAFYSLYHKLFSKREIILFLTLIVLFLLYKRPTSFFSCQGRIEVWKQYILIFKEKPITGWGIGIINAIASKPDTTLFGWRHLHNEFYHFTIELGLIGLGLIIWGIIDYFKRLKKDTIGLSINCTFIGFVLCSLFGYPVHLWVLSISGTLSYSYNYLEVL